MITETVQPNIKNFIKSLRDIGYSFEIAVADVVDNSITANAKRIDIIIVPSPEIILELLDDGFGMAEEELVEAMRLATKDPDEKRDKNDLGRFGLGLKTASFSQCKKLTVVTKKDGKICARRWDLDYISQVNEWDLISPSLSEISKYYSYKKLCTYDNGTFVVWENIDRYEENKLSETINDLRKHLSLVFHRFLVARPGIHKVEIYINEVIIEAFDPFNKDHPATQQLPEEKIFLYGEQVIVQAFILPHHSKITRSEYEYFATSEGYIKSQGFYLYRENRLLICGTWWGLHKATDAHKLVRIKIDISSAQDRFWGIDVKKSKAYPSNEIKSELRRIINKVTTQGSKPYSGRGRKIKDNTSTRFWELIPYGNKLRFELNQQHPLLVQMFQELSDEQTDLVEKYLKCVQSYIPIEAIQFQLQQRPHDIDQNSILSENEVQSLLDFLKEKGIKPEEILKTEIFKDINDDDE